MKQKQVGLLYWSLYNQLLKKYGSSAEITRKELFTKLGKHFMIPKEKRHAVIDELICRKLVVRVNRDKLQLIDYKVEDWWKK